MPCAHPRTPHPWNALAWVVYDNLLVPGKSPSLSGYESYGQVLQCLVDNVYRGLHIHCPGVHLSLIQTRRKIEVSGYSTTEITTD